MYIRGTLGALKLLDRLIRETLEGFKATFSVLKPPFGGFRGLVEGAGFRMLVESIDLLSGERKDEMDLFTYIYFNSGYFQSFSGAKETEIWNKDRRSYK
jgi:hypothetical protein